MAEAVELSIHSVSVRFLELHVVKKSFFSPSFPRPESCRYLDATRKEKLCSRRICCVTKITPWKRDGLCIKSASYFEPHCDISEARENREGTDCERFLISHAKLPRCKHFPADRPGAAPKMLKILVHNRSRYQHLSPDTDNCRLIIQNDARCTFRNVVFLVGEFAELHQSHVPYSGSWVNRHEASRGGKFAPQFVRSPAISQIQQLYRPCWKTHERVVPNCWRDSRSAQRNVALQLSSQTKYACARVKMLNMSVSRVFIRYFRSAAFQDDVTPLTLRDHVSPLDGSNLFFSSAPQQILFLISLL